MRRPRLASLSAASSGVAPGTASTAEGPAVGPRTHPSREPGDDRGPFGRVLVAALLLAIVTAGFLVRLPHNNYGLPWVYYYDEAQHFTSHSVAMFSGSLDPGYYQNPSAFTYLVFGALHLVYGVLGVHLAAGTVMRQFALDPTPIFGLARTLSAVLAMLGVIATFFAGRRFAGARVGLVAAAVLTFAFLPVNFSRIGVTDVGTFLPVAVATWAALRVYEDGRLVHYLVAGAATGFACGFKYTSGLVILPLLLAALFRWRADPARRPLPKSRELRYAVAAAAALVVAFAITTPYFFLHLHVALYQLKSQAQAAGGTEKLGQSQQGGYPFYFKSLTWGFGWAAAIAALVGAVLEFRRDRRRTALLLVFPVVLFLYLGVQSRYFGRWLMPIYPLLAILAGLGVVRVAELIPAKRAVQGAVVLAIAAAVLIQPVAADLRTQQVLGRTDTRQLARDWLVARYPPSLRIVIEPAVPDDFHDLTGSTPHNRSKQFVTAFIRDIRRGNAVDTPLGADTTYAATLRPSNIDSYRKVGYCMVETMGLIRGRVENGGTPAQRAYYQRLVKESKLLYAVSPFKRGAKPVPLDFDFSYDYYPTAYYRPGTPIDIYRLNNCKQAYGRVPLRPFGTTGLDKGVQSSYIPPQLIAP